MQMYFHFKQVPLYCTTQNTVDLLCLLTTWAIIKLCWCSNRAITRIHVHPITQNHNHRCFNEGFSQFTCGHQLFLLRLCFLLALHTLHIKSFLHFTSKSQLLLGRTALLSVCFSFGYFLWLVLFKLFFFPGTNRGMTKSDCWKLNLILQVLGLLTICGL